MVTVFGEIYGVSKRGKMVQKLFDYGRESIGFIVFDVAVHTDDGLKFMDHDKMQELVTGAGLDVSPVLFSGDFESCLEWSRENKEDKSPWGGDHVREGHVIRPVTETRMPCRERVLFKDKGSKFFEVHCAKKPKIPSVLPDEFKVEVEELMLGCTDHRFDTVKSKETEDTQRNIGAMITLMRDDIFEDLGQEMAKRYEPKQLNMLKRQLSKAIGSHVCGWMGH